MMQSHYSKMLRPIERTVNELGYTHTRQWHRGDAQTIAFHHKATGIRAFAVEVAFDDATHAVTVGVMRRGEPYPSERSPGEVQADRTVTVTEPGGEAWDRLLDVLRAEAGRHKAPEHRRSTLVGAVLDALEDAGDDALAVLVEAARTAGMARAAAKALDAIPHAEGFADLSRDEVVRLVEDLVEDETFAPSSQALSDARHLVTYVHEDSDAADIDVALEFEGKGPAFAASWNDGRNRVEVRDEDGLRLLGTALNDHVRAVRPSPAHAR